MDKILEFINSVPKELYLLVEIVAALLFFKWFFSRKQELSIYDREDE